MIVVFTGLPGSGKSYKLGRTVVDILYRNKKLYDKSGFRRILYTNLQLQKAVLDEFEGFVEFWTDLRQLTPLRDCDVVIDEIATYFDARLWETLSLEMRRWLAQHRKFGIEIYGTCQDFAQVDKAFRRLTSDLLYISKVAGSRDISATRPNPKYIWGFSIIQVLDPTVYDELKSKFASSGIPRIMFISRKGTEIFDTRAEVKLSKALPLRHLEKACENDSCDFHKIVHV
jgi:hypothetical protein